MGFGYVMPNLGLVDQISSRSGRGPLPAPQPLPFTHEIFAQGVS